MKWRKFSEKKPENNKEIHIRGVSFSWSTFHHGGHVSYSSGILWLGGNLALCQEYYQWLDESEDSCPCCGKTK